MTREQFLALYEAFADEPVVEIDAAMNLGAVRVRGWLPEYMEAGAALYAAAYLETQRQQKMIAATAIANIAQGAAISSSPLSPDSILNNYELQFRNIEKVAKANRAITGIGL